MTFGAKKWCALRRLRTLVRFGAVLFAIGIILTPQLLSVPENLFAFQLW